MAFRLLALVLLAALEADARLGNVAGTLIATSTDEEVPAASQSGGDIVDEREEDVGMAKQKLQETQDSETKAKAAVAKAEIVAKRDADRVKKLAKEKTDAETELSEAQAAAEKAHHDYHSQENVMLDARDKAEDAAKEATDARAEAAETKEMLRAAEAQMHSDWKEAVAKTDEAAKVAKLAAAEKAGVKINPQSLMFHLNEKTQESIEDTTKRAKESKGLARAVMAEGQAAIEDLGADTAEAFDAIEDRTQEHLANVASVKDDILNKIMAPPQDHQP